MFFQKVYRFTFKCVVNLGFILFSSESSMISNDVDTDPALFVAVQV